MLAHVVIDLQILVKSRGMGIELQTDWMRTFQPAGERKWANQLLVQECMHGSGWLCSAAWPLAWVSVAPRYWMALLCVLNVKNDLGILFRGRGEMNARTLTGISSG